MTDAMCIEYLQKISKTPQDEEVLHMLEFYNVRGILDLTSYQIQYYTKAMKRKAEIACAKKKTVKKAV